MAARRVTAYGARIPQRGRKLRGRTAPSVPPWGRLRMLDRRPRCPRVLGPGRATAAPDAQGGVGGVGAVPGATQRRPMKVMTILIKVTTYEKAFPEYRANFQRRRACEFGYAAADYYTVCLFLTEQHLVVGPLFNFMLPTMHQCLELLVKALATMADQDFNPRKLSYSYHTSIPSPITKS